LRRNRARLLAGGRRADARPRDAHRRRVAPLSAATRSRRRF
jgi:hypothetical protein